MNSKVKLNLDVYIHADLSTAPEAPIRKAALEAIEHALDDLPVKDNPIGCLFMDRKIDHTNQEIVLTDPSGRRAEIEVNLYDTPSEAARKSGGYVEATVVLASAGDDKTHYGTENYPTPPPAVTLAEDRVVPDLLGAMDVINSVYNNTYASVRGAALGAVLKLQQTMDRYEVLDHLKECGTKDNGVLRLASRGAHVALRTGDVTLLETLGDALGIEYLVDKKPKTPDAIRLADMVNKHLAKRGFKAKDVFVYSGGIGGGKADDDFVSLTAYVMGRPELALQGTLPADATVDDFLAWVAERIEGESK